MALTSQVRTFRRLSSLVRLLRNLSPRLHADTSGGQTRRAIVALVPITTATETQVKALSTLTCWTRATTTTWWAAASMGRRRHRLVISSSGPLNARRMSSATPRSTALPIVRSWTDGVNASSSAAVKQSATGCYSTKEAAVEGFGTSTTSLYLTYVSKDSEEVSTITAITLLATVTSRYGRRRRESDLALDGRSLVQ